MADDNITNQLLSEIGKLNGQIALMQTMIQQQGEHTRAHISEIKDHLVSRIDGLENRVEVLEHGEKEMIWKVGATATPIAAAAAAALHYLLK